MKGLTVAACILLVSAAGNPVSANGDDESFTILINQGWMSGQNYLALTKGQQAALASGIVTGLFMSPLIGAPECGPAIMALSQCTAGMTTGQLAAIIEKYLRDHPEKWNVAIGVSAVASLENSCPLFHSATLATGAAHTPEGASAFAAAHCVAAPPAEVLK